MSFTFTLRQGPARLAAQLPHISKTTARSTSGPAATIRAFHQSTPKNSLFASRTATTLLASSPLRAGAPKAGNTVSRLAAGASRTYYQQAGTSAVPASGGSTLRKLLVGGAIFGGTLAAINVVFNRETREDGGMPPYERSYLNNTFLHTGLGIGIIGLTARQMVQTGFVYRIMVTNPWMVAIGGLALSFGTMIGTRSISPDK